VGSFSHLFTLVSTSKKKKFRKIAGGESRQVDACVVRNYERLLRETHGQLVIKRGADYHLAPPVGTSKLLAQSLLGRE
jgi:hypothetical protein